MAVKVLTAPILVPIYFIGLGVWKRSAALQRRKPTVEQQVEVLQPWMPTTDVERAVYAALILSGQPVNNRRLAELMDCLRVKPHGGWPSLRASSARPARAERS